MSTHYIVTRDDIAREALALLAATTREFGPGPHGGLCLYAAWSARRVLRDHGHPARIAGGSLSWPRLAADEDDGEVATHFSFMFDPSDCAPRMVRGAIALPEIHLWVVAGAEVVDLTTGRLPFVCAMTTGMRWTAPEPPEYLWGVPPPGAVYEEHLHATRLGTMLADRLEKSA